MTAVDGAGAGIDRARLARVLGGDDIRWLVDRARTRMERGEEPVGRVVLTGATDAQRTAVQRLLGRAPTAGRSLTVSLEEVDAVLRRSGISATGLPGAVVELTGPVTLRADAEAAEARAWESAYGPLADACSARPELAEWYARLRGTGLVRRLLGGAGSAAPVLRTLAGVVAALPAEGIGLATFAAETCGDAHALDDGRPLGTLALGAARAVAGAPAGSGAEWRRETWAAAGVLKDDLSATVLAAGLPGDDSSSTGRALAALTAAGQPAVVTLRQLVQDPPRPLPRGTPAYVCENPAVIGAAADRLGAACPPLVCTQGQPSAAAVALLRLLAEGGAELRYHGDFDWGGVRIANALLRRVPWRPWRYTADDYRAAAKTLGGGNGFTGVPAEAAWDGHLADAMAVSGMRIEEEAVLDLLLDDLARSRALSTGAGE